MQENASPWRVAIIYGIIGAIFSIAYLVFQYKSGMMDPSAIANAEGGFNVESIMKGAVYNFALWVIYTVIYFLAVVAYRKKLGGFITFGEGFKVAFYSVVIKGLVAMVGSFIYFYFFIPEFFTELMDVVMEMMEEQGNAPPEAIEMQRNILGFFYNPTFMSISAFLSTLAGGALLSLIAAAIGKKSLPPGYNPEDTAV